MQHPVLFNTSIKENIRFGVPDATDSKVFQIAEAANTLTFVESNFEELPDEEQLDVIRKDIRNLAVTRLQTPELVALSKLADKDALHLAKLVLENSDAIFNKWLEDEPQFFMDFVKHELCGQDITGLKWDDVIVRVEWKWKFCTWLDQQDDADYTTEAKEHLRSMTVSQPLQFDGETLERTIAEIRTLKGMVGFNTLFQRAVEKAVAADDFKERFREPRVARLEELFVA